MVMCSEPNGADLNYMEDLLKEVEANKIPAPSPIEQRWSSGSRSPMSPAAAAAVGASAEAAVAATPMGAKPGALFSWVGIIMYMPSDDPKQRAAITKRCAGIPVHTVNIRTHPQPAACHCV